MTRRLIALIIALLFGSMLTVAPGRADSPAVSEYSIDDLAFFAGHWKGEMFGGVGEEAWMAPDGGCMIGSYRLVSGDKMVFSEYFIIQETDEGIIFRFKHFNNDYTTWEDAKGVPPMTWKLVSLENNTARFDGMGEQSHEYMVYQLLEDGRLMIKVAPHDPEDSDTGFEVYLSRLS
ncbi:MAG: DUF6265 family protein [Planctomycetota bacterium]|jgi:hypothetical protein